jgi:hypothetical protein
MGAMACTRGKEIVPNRRGFGGDFLGLAMFIPVSPGGMTCGTSTSTTEGEKRRKRFGGEKKRAIGRFLNPG